MKRLLQLLFLCSICYTTEAQNLFIDSDKLQALDAFQNPRKLALKKPKMLSDTTILKLPTQPYYLVNPKPGIHRLPQDNMPCFVPDMYASVTMPNGWKGEKRVPFRGAQPWIPNPAKPFIITPSRPLLTYPDVDNTK